MQKTVLLALLDRTPVLFFVVAALTLGLAPFFPKPHVLEKLQMLFSGNLRRPIDWFDLFLHGLPWLLLVAKVTRDASGSR
jgi:hypothetical protein